jgi:hypothetical protein
MLRLQSSHDAKVIRIRMKPNGTHYIRKELRLRWEVDNNYSISMQKILYQPQLICLLSPHKQQHCSNCLVSTKAEVNL